MSSHSLILLCLVVAVIFISAIEAGDLDLDKWQITLPIDKNGKKKGSPVTVEPKQKKPYFYKKGDKWVFWTPIDGAHTHGSHYPRTELREAFGSKKAAWSTTKGEHVLEFEASVQHMASKKQDMCVGQLHDEKDDFAQWRFRDGQAQIIYLGEEYIVVDEDYKLGTKFKGKMVVKDGKVSMYYNDMKNPVVTFPLKNNGVYFKLGSYIHTNPSFGENKNDYGEVWVYSASIKRP